MKSCGNNFNYFSENKLTKIGKFSAVQTYAYVLPVGLGGWAPCPLVYTTEVKLGVVLCSPNIPCTSQSGVLRSDVTFESDLGIVVV